MSSKPSQKVGCHGEGCHRAATCARHTLASEMHTVLTRACGTGSTALYEHLPDQPARVVRLQAEWASMPRTAVPGASSVFDFGYHLTGTA